MTVWLGKISYSLYLWHFPVLLFANAKIHNDKYSLLAVNIAADLFFACCSYYVIEQHFKKLRERFPTSAALVTAGGFRRELGDDGA